MTTSDLLNRVSVRRDESPMIFVLDNDKSDDKISCHYYNPIALQTFIELENGNDVTTIKDITNSVKYGAGKWELNYTDYVPQEYLGAVLLLQVSNLNSDGTLNLETGREKYIKRELHDKWLSSQVKPNNIAIAITGTTIGLSSLIPDNFPEANLNQALGIMDLKDKVTLNNTVRSINKEYIITYLNSGYANVQFKRYGSFRSGQSGLATGEIKKVMIPIPENSVQNEIVSKIHKAKTEIQKAINEYNQVINDISELFESIFPIKYNYTQHTFYVDTLKHDRLDYLYNSKELEAINLFLKVLTEQKMVELVSPSKYHDKSRMISKSKYELLKYSTFKYVDIDNVDKEIGFIRGHQEDVLLKLPTRARQIMKTNDVLLPSPIGSTKGVSIVSPEYDNQLCSTGFLQLKASSMDEALMLFAILKSTLMQRYFYLVQSGCIQPSIAKKIFNEEIKIPLPIGNYKNDLDKKIKKYKVLSTNLFKLISLKKHEFEKQFESDIHLCLKGQYH